MCEYEYEYLIITWVRVRVRVQVDEYECWYRSMIYILYYAAVLHFSVYEKGILRFL